PRSIAGDAHEAGGELDRLLLRPGVDEREAVDELLGFGEWPVGHADLAGGAAELRALARPDEPAGHDDDAGAHHLRGELSDFHHLLGRGRRRFRIGGVGQQELHRRLLCWRGVHGSFHGSTRRQTASPEIDTSRIFSTATRKSATLRVKHGTAAHEAPWHAAAAPYASITVES